MKVILCEDIQKLGLAGETKDVSDGFARNYLLPKNLVLTATAANLRKWESEKSSRLKKISKSLEKACGKADAQTLLNMHQRIERKLLAKKKQRLNTNEIGKAVLQELKKYDKMAYIRFATIHKSMEDPKELRKEVSLLS